MAVGIIARRLKRDEEKVIKYIHGLILGFNIIHLILASYEMSYVNNEKHIRGNDFINERMIASWSELEYNIFTTTWGLVVLLYSYMYRRHKERLQKLIPYSSDRRLDLAGLSILTDIFWLAAATSLIEFVNRDTYCTYGEAYCAKLLPRAKGMFAVLIILGFFNFFLWFTLASDAGVTAYRRTRDASAASYYDQEESNIGTEMDRSESRAEYTGSNSQENVSSQGNVAPQN